MHRKSIDSFINGLLVVALLCLPVAWAGDPDLQSAMRQKEEADAQVEEYEGRLKWAVATTNQLVWDLSQLTEDIYVSQNELGKVQARLAVLDGEVTQLQERIVETSAHASQIDELAKARLRTLQKNSTMSYLEVLFSATSYSDFIQRFDLVRTLLESDLALLEKLQQLRNSQENDRRRLEDELSEQRRLEEQQLLYSSNLSMQQEEKLYLVDNIAQQKEAWAAAKAEWEHIAEAAGEEIRRQQEKYRGKALGTGEYAWPLDINYTYITSEFGMREDPFGGTTQNNHGGMDIAADSGAEILAVDSGIVIMAEYGYNGGYGNMVVIDHGGGIASLYGHCTELFVSTGQSITKGETIATVGSTGWSTGPHLHIEFRVDGVRVEPRDYLFD